MREKSIFNLCDLNRTRNFILIQFKNKIVHSITHLYFYTLKLKKTFVIHFQK
jgi:hypothetical protein